MAVKTLQTNKKYISIPYHRLSIDYLRFIFALYPKPLVVIVQAPSKRTPSPQSASFEKEGLQ